ncbi:hypothetical protein F4825DRAFT_313132 [Nemania diffusa]|nr:hypothetical protein F4825DRAFT_313132 [Nemania diffusa]
MDPPSTPNSPLAFTPNQTGSHSNTEHAPSDLEASTTGIDRRTKKRIQNRVAQRTYRTRIKQRLHDLQQEVHTLRQKGEGPQRDARPCEMVANNRDNEGMRFYTPFSAELNTTLAHSHNKERPNLEITCQDDPGIKTTDSGLWASIPSQSNTWNPPLEETEFLYNNAFHIPARAPFELTSGATMHDLSPPSLPMHHSSSINRSPTYHREYQRDALEFSSAVESNMQQHITNRTSNHFDAEGRNIHLQNFNCPRPSPWGHKMELNTSSDDSTPFTATRHTNIPPPSIYPDGITAESTMAMPTQWPGAAFINPQATVEEKFEYILSCGQRVGFDSFDTMALHYYTRNFNPTSALALEQRMSRNRRLPELLAELRKQSTTWSTWQRRGYEDQTLKAAEEICVTEYSEFLKSEVDIPEQETLHEAALGDALPNLWALLTGLASSNPQLSQRQISEVVFLSARLLCGLDGTQNQSVTSSRESPR